MNENKLLNITLGIIVTALVVYILKTLKSIFIPLTFAIFLSLIFAPLVEYLKKKRFPQFLIIIILVLIIFITFNMIGTIIYTSVASFAKNFPSYEEKITLTIQNFIYKLEIPKESLKEYIRNKVNWFDIADKLSLSKVITNTMGTFINFFINLLLTIIFMIFIISERTQISQRISNVITEKRKHKTIKMVQAIERQIMRYIFNKTIISLITGLIGMFFVWLYGIDFVIVSGLLLFILNYIPSLGSFIASAFPIMISLVEYGLGWQTFAITISLILLQITMGNIVEPKLMGSGLRLSPLVILISLIFWYWIWGPVGMILAIPITSALSIMIRQVESLKILSAIISSEPYEPDNKRNS